MSCKQRLRKLESINPIDLMAFFSMPRGLANKREIQSKLWENFVRNGGDKRAIPAFLAGIAETDGFVFYVRFSLLKECVMDKSKNPAEFGSHSP
jgi:hypothetical protein